MTTLRPMYEAVGRPGVRIVRAPLPLILRAAWVPSERLILVDEALDDEGACAAVAEVAMTAATTRRERETR